MTTLPERYQQPYATPAGQPTPTRDLVVYQPEPIEPYGERQPVVYVPSADNPHLMVAVPKQYVQPMQPSPARDLTPQPLIDPKAQRMIAGGFGIGAAGAGVGYGMGQMLAGFALMGTSGLFLIAGIILAGLMRGGRGDNHVHNTTNVHQKWFGKTNISN